MSEMVEKVARAIAPPELRGSVREIDLARARAAIAAMREPTQAMVDGAWRQPGPEKMWRYMIDAALEPVDDDVDERMGGKAK